MSAPLARIRRDVLGLHAYAVQDSAGLIKLDAMENPHALPAQLQQALGERLGAVALHRYPGDRVADLRAGKARVRQRPGPKNALGAVKFAMPNPMDIYLHSTPARELFQRSRRDLSHGCIRVEHPAALAQYVLGRERQWNADAIQAALQPGPTRHVDLAQPVPVVIFYATASVDAEGRPRFAKDIYGRDARLERELAARHRQIVSAAGGPAD